MSYLTQSEAYAILKLPIGADRDAVRNSYKRLAQQWLPEKHQHSSESVNSFCNISKAYSRLCSDIDRVEMNIEDMYTLFNKIVHPKSQKIKRSEDDAANARNNASNRKRETFKESGLIEQNNSHDLLSKKEDNTFQKTQKLEKNERTSFQQDNNGIRESNSENSRRKNELTLQHHHYNNNNVSHQQSVNDETTLKLDDVVLRSRQFAIEGNGLANKSLYSEAIDQFTKAIKLDPTDFRFFGNRSFCHERQGNYSEALADADKAISLAPEWPKGYFRKGKALSGNKAFAEAEEAYLQVLKLDSKCPDAKLELIGVRAQQLMEMGFKKQQAIKAIQQCETVQAALESLLSNQISEGPLQDGASSSDENDDTGPKTTDSKSNSVPASTVNNGSNTKNDSNSKQQSKRQKQQKAPLPPIPQHHYEQAQRQILLNKQQDVVKMNPRNPEGLTSLWVGNVLPEAKQEALIKLFSKYGQLQSVKCIPEKFCAFINFVNKDCAGKAMESLQGTDLFGQKLLIKFPDHPVNPLNGEKPPTKSTTKVIGQPSRNNALSSLQTSKQVQSANPNFASNNSSSSASVTVSINSNTSSGQTASASSQGAPNNPRTTGPVNGDECYFWRTTGCQFTGTCRYKHVPDHKGVDRKPWHKSK